MEKRKHLDKWCWSNWTTEYRRMQIDPYLSPSTNSGLWIKNLNINPATLNLIEEKEEGSLECIGIGDDFLYRVPIVQALRSTINK